MRKLLPTLTIVALPLLAAATFLACEGSGGDDSEGAGAAVTTATTEAPSTTVAAAPTTTTVPATPDAPTEGASCDSDTLLTATRAALQTDIEIVSVTVEECQNGYARVYANPDQSGCGEGGSCYENEQVFLSDTDGQWIFLDAGTGITCSDDDLSPTTADACEALGLR